MKLLIIGHGGFPQGMKEALELITGEQKNVTFQHLDEKVGHSALEIYINKFLDENKKAILFADLTGGAPHKIGARAIMNKKNKRQVIVSGVSIAVLIQMTLMLPSLDDAVDLKVEIQKIVNESKNMAMVMGV